MLSSDPERSCALCARVTFVFYLCFRDGRVPSCDAQRVGCSGENNFQRLHKLQV